MSSLVEETQMISEAVTVALITGGLTLTGTIISLVSVNSKTLYRISILEKNLENLKLELQLKQDKHNAIIERMYATEKVIDIHEERLKELDDALKELKERIM